MQSTATNIIKKWCQDKRRLESKLKPSDYKQIISYAVDIGVAIGLSQARQTFQNLVIEKKEGAETEPIESGNTDKIE